MEFKNLKIGILPNSFLKSDGTFDKDNALILSGKIAGVCYDKEGFQHLENEPLEKTMKRIDLTLNNGHHSVYDHINISFNLQNIPKILAMVLNNEHQYTTSEKSARYTPIVRTDDSIITTEEEQLYKKWLEIFKVKIKQRYGSVYDDKKIQKLAQENARYLVTTFAPTQMIYTTSLRQINYIASYMEKYIEDANKDNSFEQKLSLAMQAFIEQLDDTNVLVDGLMKNEKHRNLSLFGNNLDEKKDYFGDVYQTTYKASFAQLAQAQRHRTLNYQIQVLDDKEYFVPPIIASDDALVWEWLNDMDKVKGVNPQGELVYVCETGEYKNFILKCKERLCTNAQLEIMNQTKETLANYKKALEDSGSVLAQDIEQYSHGARCTFKDFDCSCDCKFKEGKRLIREI